MFIYYLICNKSLKEYKERMRGSFMPVSHHVRYSLWQAEFPTQRGPASVCLISMFEDSFHFVFFQVYCLTFL